MSAPQLQEDPVLRGQVRNSRGALGPNKPSAWWGRSALYQLIQALSRRRASWKLMKLCCQTRSSFNLRKKRSMIRFAVARSEL
jgi:hypothetical protein